MGKTETDAEFLDRRIDQMAQGFKEAMRREVARLKRMGLPIYVAQNGKVIELPHDTPEPKNRPSP